jgi:hypothetical protein
MVRNGTVVRSRIPNDARRLRQMELDVGPYIPEDGDVGVGPFTPAAGAKTIKFAGYEVPSDFSMVFHILLPPAGEESDGTRVDGPPPPQVRTVLARGSVEIGFLGGRPRCHGLAVDYSRDGIDSGTLRAIPIAMLVRVSVMMASSYMRGLSRLENFEFEDIVSDITSAVGRRRQSLNPNVVAAARIYREALATGRNPGPTIAGELHMTHTSARRLVHQARVAGLLGGSLGQGRLGEQPTESQK